MPKGTHGTPIWGRKLTGKAVLKSAKSNRLLLYRSTRTDGDDDRRLGHGRGPEGQGAQGRLAGRDAGRTGRSGIADACAPSIAGMPAKYDQHAAQPLAEGGLRGRAHRLRGPRHARRAHPYLIGVSEGRGVLDMVRAARKLDTHDRQAAS